MVYTVCHLFSSKMDRFKYVYKYGKELKELIYFQERQRYHFSLNKGLDSARVSH